jgi:hypothetical protein
MLECVHSLVEGAPRPDDIIVIGREGDTPTREAVERARNYVPTTPLCTPAG